jgi:monoamine oxidase
VRLTTQVAVVGAGYAGLAAAWELRRQNTSVLVLESRSRVGGRIHTIRASDGTPIDLGGAWVSSAQQRLLHLASEMGVTTYRQFTRGDNVYVRPDGVATRYRGLIPPTLDPDAAQELTLAIGFVNAAAAGINPAAPWEATADLTAAELRAFDSATVADWIESEDSPLVSAEAKSAFYSVMRGVFGLEANAVSFLHLVFESATAGGLDTLLSTGPGGAEERHVTGGAQSIASEIARRLGRSVLLGAAVREVSQLAGQVEIRSDAYVVTARRVIVTIPTALVSAVRFRPPLPPNRAQLNQRFPGGSVWKVWCVYDRAFWRDDGFSGESIDPRRTAYVAQTLDGGLRAGLDAPGLLAGFVAADRARFFATLSPARRRQVVLADLVLRFGSKAAQLSPTIQPNYVETSWAAEEWTHGSYAGFPGPGVYTAVGFGPALRHPCGRVHWAGVDTATSWYGTMEGAVQSGQRAAAEVLAAGV